MVNYIKQLKDKSIKILIPGAGNGYEAEYLFNNGFKNVFVLDVSSTPLENLKLRVPTFPTKQLIQGNFFFHKNTYNLIIEQTFFCSFKPTQDNRKAYVKQMYNLLEPKGKLVGLWFDIPLKNDNKRPFGGNRAEYLNYLSPYFDVKLFNSCYNSIPARKDNELFGVFIKKLTGL